MFIGYIPGIRGSNRKKLSVFILFLATVISLPGMQIFAETSKIHFNIPSQDVRSALIEFADRTDLSLIYDIEELGELKTNTVSGVYSPLEALWIMLGDTGLIFELTGEETIAVSKNKPQPDKQEKDGEEK